MQKEEQKFGSYKKARSKGIISAQMHTDDAISKYDDIELLSYQAAIINRTFK